MVELGIIGTLVLISHRVNLSSMKEMAMPLLPMHLCILKYHSEQIRNFIYLLITKYAAIFTHLKGIMTQRML